MTINKAITIDGGTGAGWASITAAGVHGIIVTAGVGDVVILRNLSINGLKGPNMNVDNSGIRFLGGASLLVEKCTIFGFKKHGIDMDHNASGELVVTDSTIENIASVAIRVTAINAPKTHVSNVRIHKAAFGLDVLKGSATISNSVVSHVSSQAIVGETSGTILNVSNCVLNENGTGISAFTPGVTVNVANCDIFNNGTGVQIAAGATGNRFGNSRVINNGTDVSGTFSLQPSQ